MTTEIAKDEYKQKKETTPNTNVTSIRKTNRTHLRHLVSLWIYPTLSTENEDILLSVHNLKNSETELIMRDDTRIPPNSEMLTDEIVAPGRLSARLIESTP